MDQKCGVCGGSLSGALHRCKHCTADFHRDCWDYADGCSTYGCVGVLSNVELPDHPYSSLPSTGSRSRGWSEPLRGLERVPGGAWRFLGAMVALVIPVITPFIWISSWSSHGVPIWVYLGLGGAFLGGLGFIVLGPFLPSILHGLFDDTRPGSLTSTERIEHLKRSAQTDSRNPNLMEALGFEQLSSGDFKGARESFDRAIALRPGNQLAIFYKARSEALLGRPERAKALFRQAQSMEPGSELARKAEWWFGKMNTHS